VAVLSIDATRAAARVVDAAKHGDAEIVITWTAKLAVAAAGIFPKLTASATGLANRFLPKPAEHDGDHTFSGWQSGSEWAPSPLTRLSERAASLNNELP